MLSGVCSSTTCAIGKLKMVAPFGSAFQPCSTGSLRVRPCGKTGSTAPCRAVLPKRSGVHSVSASWESWASYFALTYFMVMVIGALGGVVKQVVVSENYDVVGIAKFGKIFGRDITTQPKTSGVAHPPSAYIHTTPPVRPQSKGRGGATYGVPIPEHIYHIAPPLVIVSYIISFTTCAPIKSPLSYPCHTRTHKGYIFQCRQFSLVCNTFFLLHSVFCTPVTRCATSYIYIH